MSSSDSMRPGKLGDAAMRLEIDPRLDPRLAAALVMAGELAPGVEPPPAGADYQTCLDYCAEFEAANAVQNDQLRAMLPEFPGVTTDTQTITGVDGNDIVLHVHRPTSVSGPVPCVIHFHGGGMVIMSAEDPGFERWRNSLADRGVVCVGVEFRNGGGRLGTHPFPAGLNDCASAVQWVASNRAELGVSGIVLSGESGGGNLSIATALKANREGWIDQVAGVFAMCPYISGSYAAPPESLVSLKENDGYLLNGAVMGAMAKVYDPQDEHAGNPLAWPLQAQEQDLQGLPPTIISVNELDPLRDEGLAFYRKLLASGVASVGRTVHGTPHAGDGMFPDVIPEVYADTIGAVCDFARRVCG
jgi:acetyl esterase/lipase